MRILHLTESFWPRIGGAEIFVQCMAHALQLRGHACLIVTNLLDFIPATDEIDGLPIQCIPFTQALLKRDIRAIARVSAALQNIIRDWRPDLIHLHSHQAAAFFYLRLRHAAPTPTIYTTHAPFLLQNTANPLMAQLLSSVERVAATSQSMRDQVIRAVPQAAPKTRVIYLGLESPTDAPTPLAQHSLVLFCAARLTDEKGLDVLLHSLTTVLMKFPDLKAIIAGDGPNRAALQTLSMELGLTHAVSFPGWIAPGQIPVEINRAALVVAPSRMEETFGLTVLQAMQMARPVVASRVGAFPELVADGETGLLVPPNDAGALGRAIIYILENPTHAAEMGQRGRERAKNLFDLERCISEYILLYQQALK